MTKKMPFNHHCCICGALLPEMTFEKYLIKGFAVKLGDGTLRYFCTKHRGQPPLDAGTGFVRANVSKSA